MTALTTPRLAEPRRLPLIGKVLLVAEIVATYVRVRTTMGREDIRSVVARVRSGAAVETVTGPDASAAGARLAGAVSRVLGPLPADSRCLVSSLVLCRMLARRGIASSVVIGVRGGARFGAHAWVEHDGRVLLPGAEGEFERLVAL